MTKRKAMTVREPYVTQLERAVLLCDDYFSHHPASHPLSGACPQCAVNKAKIAIHVRRAGLRAGRGKK